MVTLIELAFAFVVLGLSLGIGLYTSVLLMEKFEKWAKSKWTWLK